MFNTGIGQHILKNPLIVNSIIDKVGIDEKRQRFVCHLFRSAYTWYNMTLCTLIPALGEAEVGRCFVQSQLVLHSENLRK